MSPRQFDRVMISVEIGRDLKLRPLTDSEWRAFVGGVLAIAGKSHIRGRLLVGDRAATAEDIAAQAGVRVAAARSALTKLRGIGMVYDDTEFDCECVHDFEEWNPPPKHDRTAAERQQRRREKLKRHAVTSRSSRDDVTAGHALEGKGREGEEKNTPQPPQAGERDNVFTLRPPNNGRKRDRDQWEKECGTVARRVFPELGEALAASVVRDAVTHLSTASEPVDDQAIRDWARRSRAYGPHLEEAS